MSDAQDDTTADTTTWVVAFALGALATWRLTHLVVSEDGPADVVLRLRRAAGSSVLGQLMDCFYCASVWVALPVALTLTRGPAAPAPWRRFGASGRIVSPGRVAIWLALSGAACLLEQATRSDILVDPRGLQADEPDAVAPHLRAVPGGVA